MFKTRSSWFSPEGNACRQGNACLLIAGHAWKVSAIKQLTWMIPSRNWSRFWNKLIEGYIVEKHHSLYRSVCQGRSRVLRQWCRDYLDVRCYWVGIWWWRYWVFTKVLVKSCETSFMAKWVPWLREAARLWVIARHGCKCFGFSVCTSIWGRRATSPEMAPTLF
jgi:hypothetical protein